MRLRIGIACLLTALLLPGKALVQAATESSMYDQIAVQVTVYNANIGLIKDTRQVELPVGKGELRFMDVASHIMPATVHTESTNLPDSLTILEQNYEYDLMNASKLLDKYVGKKIKIVDWNKFQDRRESVDAILLSNNEDQIYRINGEIYLGHPGYKVLPELPENLIARPTLTWLYENESRRTHDLEVSYLTGNIDWKADYVLVLGEDDDTADLSGWVTLDNRSGATYTNAQLKLVAGDVNRVRDDGDFAALEMVERRAFKAKAPQFEEEAFFEYHIYNLQRKTTVKDRQTKQVNLLEARGIVIGKELLVYGKKYYHSRKYAGQDMRQPVSVYVHFHNTQANHLGMPLPAGIMRLYKADADQSLQFIGEDRIDHTPDDEKIRLRIGQAFDVVAQRVQTDYRRITTRRHESEWEISIRNRKDEPVRIGVVEPVSGNWEVISNSHPYKKEDAFTLRFDVKIPGGGEEKVRYRVRVGI